MTTAEALAMLEMAFNEGAGALATDTLRENISGWDSMGSLMLMAELDERFGIVVTPEQLTAMAGVPDIFDLLKSSGVLRA